MFFWGSLLFGAVIHTVLLKNLAGKDDLVFRRVLFLPDSQAELVVESSIKFFADVWD